MCLSLHYGQVLILLKLNSYIGSQILETAHTQININKRSKLADWRRTYIIAVESVENSGDVAAQDANGDTSIIQGHPAAAGLLWAMAAEQVVTHRTEHTQL